MPILESGLRGYPSISHAIEDLPFDVIVPGIELPRFTPSGVYTLQGQPESSPSLILNNIYATNYQPAYLVIRQGLEGSFLHEQTIGASAVVEKLQVGSQTAEYVHGDWSVEDNSIPFASRPEMPRLRWDAENGSHWLWWKAGDLYISLEFHTRFSDRLIEEDERITKEFLLAIAESFVPVEGMP
ncbi:MAG TPA: hypothetical protein VLA49_02000 [Anaerolineales bacterium]|nr:hypothetical protein [Anaerolineales bacterium]